MRYVILLMICMFVASYSFAIMDPDPDGIGIYFDLDANVVCHNTADPFELVTAYLIATNTTCDSGIGGWEAYILITGDAAAAPAWTVDGFDTDPSPEAFQVRYICFWHFWSPTMVLATWTGYMLDPADTLSFYLSGYPGSEYFPNSPSYIGADIGGNLYPLQVSTGTGQNLPVAMINSPSCDVLPNETMTVSTMKMLYK